MYVVTTFCDSRRPIWIGIKTQWTANPTWQWRLMVVRLLSASSCCGSPRDVAVYVFDINQPSLPTPFYSVHVSVYVFMALSTVFHSINSPDNSAFSLCSSGLISAVLVFSTMYLYESLLQPWCNPPWLTGLKAPTNSLTNSCDGNERQAMTVFFCCCSKTLLPW